MIETLREQEQEATKQAAPSNFGYVCMQISNPEEGWKTITVLHKRTDALDWFDRQTEPSRVWYVHKEKISLFCSK